MDEMNCQGDVMAIMALEADIKKAEDGRRAIVDRYRAPDKDAEARARIKLNYPRTEVYDELKRAMRSLGDIKVNYEKPYGRKFRLADGEMYEYQHRTTASLDSYLYNLIHHGEDIAAGIKRGDMRHDFLLFWTWLKANKDVVGHYGPEEEPALPIVPRDVYYAGDYGHDLMTVDNVRAIKVYRERSDRVYLRLTPKWRQAHQHMGTEFYFVNVKFTTALVAQIPEITDLLRLRDEADEKYATLPEDIHEAANESLGKWLTITAI